MNKSLIPQLEVKKGIEPESIKNCTLCITGYSGYIGSHLLQSLLSCNVEPFLIPRPFTEPEPVAGARVANRWTLPQELAAQLMCFENPILLNLAGYFVNQHEPGDISPLVSGNLEFPLLIFEAARLSTVSRIVNIGTTWEFSSTGKDIPANLYAHLKAANSRIQDYYCKISKFTAVNLKLNDTFGGQDGRDKLLPMLKRCWESGEVASLRQKNQPINLLYIDDVISGILHAAVMKWRGTNRCKAAALLGATTLPIGLLVETINELTQHRLNVAFEDEGTHRSNLRQVWAEAPTLEDWEPAISLEQGLLNYFNG